MTGITEALKALRPNSSFGVIGNRIKWNDPDNPQPTEKEINGKIAELQAAEPMRLLRQERNQKLTETDWMANSDVTMSDEWKTYRQALRNLPSIAEPQLDVNGQLTNVTWPTKPE